MSIIKPISRAVTQDFDGSFYMERPGYLRTVDGVKRGKRVSFTGASYRVDLHLAIDYGAPIGTPVHAVQRGKILAQGTDSTGGVFIYQRVKASATHQIVAFYYHLKAGSLKYPKGAIVPQGATIALSGNTGGKSTGGHLHFTLMRAPLWWTPSMMYKSAMRFDPQPFIDGRALATII